MFDFDHFGTSELGDLARRAFILGHQHGSKRATPWDASAVWYELGLQGCEHRRGHKTKIRQVYGAGFDMAAMMRRVRAKEEARC